MTDQKRRNIRLLIICGILLTAVILSGIFTGDEKDSLGIDRDRYAIANTFNISRVTSEDPDGKLTELAFRNGRWLLEDTYPANPLNVRLLFATVQKISVRREVAVQLQDSLETAFSENGRTLTFYEENGQSVQFEIVGDEDRSLTYLRDGAAIYLLEIPGYRAYIYGLLAVADPEWRHPNIFNEFTWRNLGRIEVDYRIDSLEDVTFVQAGDFYEVEGLQSTDTTRLTDYIDYISLLEVDGYLETADTAALKPLMAIRVYDVGDNAVEARFWESADKRNIIGLSNEKSLFELLPEKFVPLLRPRNYFAGE